MTETKPQLHISMVQTFESCGYRGLRQYGHRFGIWPKEPTPPPSPALIIGIGTHKAIETNMINKIETGKLLPRTEVTDAAEYAVSALWEGGVFLTEEEAADEKQTYHDILEMTKALVRVHYDNIAPGLRPVAAEEPFVIELTNESVDLAGKIDLREEYPDHVTGEKITVISDVKTGKGWQTARTTQLGTYSMAHKVLYGKYPDRVRIYGLKKLKNPTEQILTAIPDDEWIRPAMARIVQIIRLIDIARQFGEPHKVKDLFTPMKSDDYLCSDKFCPFAKDCEFYVRQG